MPLLAGSLLAVPVCRGAVVFSDDFSEASGTAIVGKAADTGGSWTGNAGNPAITVSSQNSCDTSGTGGVQIFNTFTSALGAGQMLTLSFDTLAPSSGTAFTGWWGVSLFDGGSEDIFVGKPGSLSEFGIDGGVTGTHGDGDTTLVNHITFTYAYDTGAYTLTTANGTVSGTGTPGKPLDNLRIGNGGDDGAINVDNLTVDISAAPVFNFHSQVPTAGSYSVSATNVISVQTTDGTSPVDTSTIVMKVDGGTVAPSISKTGSITTISYASVSPLSAGTLHTVLVTLGEVGGTGHTNSWDFTTGFSSLPLTWAGPFTAGGSDVTIFTAANDAWLGTNYQGTANKTLYFRFSENFVNTNAGGMWGGFQFFQDGNERLLIGKAGGLVNWSVAAGGVPDTDVPPATAIATNEWHTFVVRADYSADGGNTAVQVWLDPDFSKSELDQPNAPLQVSLDNTFNQIRLRCGWSPTTIQFSNIMAGASSVDVGWPRNTNVTFQAYVPGNNATSAAVSSPVGLTAILGTYGVGTNTVVMTLDGNTVHPAFSVTTNSITMSYQPTSLFVAGSAHTVAVSLTDSNNTPYSTSWSFTVDSYPTLPVITAGPIDTWDGHSVILWNSHNGWIGGNYGPTSTNTLYTRFSMVYYDYPRLTGGWSFGGLQFFQDGTERLISGDNGSSANWSVDAKEAGGIDLSPATAIALNDWHTIVIKSVYASNGPTAETIWLDPDFTKSVGNQPNAPITFSMNNTFNQVVLRCGGGTTFTEFTNIVMAASATDIGFAASVVPGPLNIQSGQLSWSGAGTLQKAPTVTGPWTDSSNQSNPQTLSKTNSAEFYRLRN